MKLESLATRLENMMTEKIKPLETNFEKMEKEMKELKDDYNFSLDHVFMASITYSWRDCRNLGMSCS